jgi:hypothetical protein
MYTNECVWFGNLQKKEFGFTAKSQMSRFVAPKNPKLIECNVWFKTIQTCFSQGQAGKFAMHFWAVATSSYILNLTNHVISPGSMAMVGARITLCNLSVPWVLFWISNFMQLTVRSRVSLICPSFLLVNHAHSNPQWYWIDPNMC